MLTKIVLCAFPDRLTAGLWRLGRLDACHAFLPDAAGLLAFAQFLNENPHAPIHLIADEVEEDYRIESLPHTYGSERAALLDRRLNQLYRTTVYRAASYIGRAKEKRRDDVFLFQALNNTECITPWIDVIRQLHLPLAGVYLLPLVSQFLLDRIKLKNPHILLTDRQTSGLRQTYFQDGKVRVSRLAPALGLDAEEGNAADIYAAETEKTRLYLQSQRLIGRDTKLSLLVLSSDHQGDAVCRQIGAEQGMECIVLDFMALGRRLGLHEQPLREYPELLYMQLVAKCGTPVNLAPASQTRDYRIQQIRSGIMLTSLVILLGGLLVSANSFINTLRQTAQMEEAALQTQIQERRYRDVARNFPETPLSGDQLKIAVELHRAIRDNAADPARMLQTLGAAMEIARDIDLKRIRWVQTADIGMTDGGAQSTGTGGRIAQGGRLYEISFIEGEIRRFSGDYRAALESVNRLVELLRKDQRVERVEVVQQPVNVSSQSDLQGSTLDAQTQQIPAADFKLKLVLRPTGRQP